MFSDMLTTLATISVLSCIVAAICNLRCDDLSCYCAAIGRDMTPYALMVHHRVQYGLSLIMKT